MSKLHEPANRIAEILGDAHYKNPDVAFDQALAQIVGSVAFLNIHYGPIEAMGILDAFADRCWHDAEKKP